MTIEDLEAALEAVSLAEAPDDWALAAYRLAVARSEAAGRPEDIDQALEMLDKAARILTADRAPVEHGRILTAAANCHRAGGRADRALELFGRAADLIAPRAPAVEHAAALINLGLAHCEAGHPTAGIEALNRAIDLATAQMAAVPGDNGDSVDDERSRLLGAALINRAQARQSLGRDEDLRAAVDDYRGAIAALPTSSLQAGMAAHGLGAAVLEMCRRGASGSTPEEAVGAFEQSLSVLGHSSFPFHHAVARHSLALAFEMRGGAGDLARALNSAHAAIAVFDPRLHASHWRTAHATLARLEAALDDVDPATGRAGHVARLLAATDETEREQLLRDRLRRAATLPPTGMDADLDALVGSLAELGLDGYRRVLRSLIGVLMELPDRLLEAACETLCRVHAGHDATEFLDETLDGVITDRLFGPQRVRVRDLLEANGWVRP
ncbi:MAG: hypothetical protein F4011_09660 [Acidimicrobiaceae bacterium]|nr:hypothetical protein [Acidimicrobiaceae bacterium]MYG98006.1 hypothetical protein [Acidimicrobiaceae bacterium]MYL04430.1 hypothetical protein [Acidimicrobiaceae bacterium]